MTKKATQTAAEDPQLGLRVHEFRAANVKRLVLVQFKTDGKGGLVIVGGDNGAGKTSVIDSFIYALGGKKAVPKGTKVIREGEVEGSVMLNLGELIINRRWTAEGLDSLTITTRDGHALKDTADVLASLGGDLMFDPLALLSMKPADRRATLLKLADLPFDLDAKNAEYDSVFGHRTDVNRQLKSARAVVENAESEIGGVNMDGPSLEDALLARQEAAAIGQDVDVQRNAVREAARWVSEAEVALVEAEAQVTVALAKRDRSVATKAEAQTRMAEAESAERIAIQASRSVDFDTLDHDVANARLRQQQSAAIAERDRMSEQANNLAEESKQLTVALEAITEQKAMALREAKMPVDGLGFDENDVTYNGLPFSQASGAEQLRVAIAIAMAKNPTARIILSKDGSLLDKNNLKILDEMTKNKGYQLIIERVGDGDEGAIVIEAGSVRQ